MTPQTILYPVAALLVLILSVMLLTVIVRMRGVKQRKIAPKRFRTIDLTGIEDKFVTPGRNFDNQFQLPMLFLALVLFILQFGLVDDFFVVSCWSFVTLRYIHSFIHLTSNNVIHRLTAFALGAIVLFVCWVRLFWLVLN